MTWQTSPTLIVARNAARTMGLTKLIGRMMPDRGYEAAFDESLFAAIRPGDHVWDVGANVGHYTQKFAAAVGPAGRVTAFEPFPSTADTLRKALIGVPNYALHVMALGATSGHAVMEEGADANSATNRITDTGSGTGVAIDIRTGDAILTAGLAEAPDVAKIDTEGFELDVLKGMPQLLAEGSGLRAVFVEVHFGILAERGMAQAPREIEALLQAAGYATRWVDPSHIAAIRP